MVLAIAVENGRAGEVDRLANQLRISVADIEQASVTAFAWAEEVARR